MSSSLATRHKVFLSYYHKDDERYRDKFEELFGHLFTNKSVREGDIRIDNSADYIRRLIRDDYITDISVIVVLVGRNTHCRKHVDWEISAAIGGWAGGHSGLLGILLPTYPGYSENEYDSRTIPQRLLDNMNSGYAKLIIWPKLEAARSKNETYIQRNIEDAFKAREDRTEKIRNSRDSLKINLCS
ncbi:MAG TPA: TIR domain-containing protein [Candidatus Acidoferrales bacterium]|nr:TIR domain-containing protein [Candidatus Acidoferrales bacterium]